MSAWNKNKKQNKKQNIVEIKLHHQFLYFIVLLAGVFRKIKVFDKMIAFVMICWKT